ncbi:MAG: hypothetical protein AAGF92_01615 [Myxococcota bacterium]
MSTAQLTLGSIVRVGFDVLATFVVWCAVFLQVFFVRDMVFPPAYNPSCGTAMVAFLMFWAGSWALALHVLTNDGVRLHRGTLARTALWLRIFPVAAVALLTFVALFAP